MIQRIINIQYIISVYYKTFYDKIVCETFNILLVCEKDFASQKVVIILDTYQLNIK